MVKGVCSQEKRKKSLRNGRFPQKLGITRLNNMTKIKKQETANHSNKPSKATKARKPRKNRLNVQDPKKKKHLPDVRALHCVPNSKLENKNRKSSALQRKRERGNRTRLGNVARETGR